MLGGGDGWNHEREKLRLSKGPVTARSPLADV